MLGVIGGSGFTSLMDSAEERVIRTPYGLPSDYVTIGDIAGRPVAFLPRHGREHQWPPHMINYRANIAALASLGVTQILAPTAAGSLTRAYRPGDMVIPDQLIDCTKNRLDTFPTTLSTDSRALRDPYCPQFRASASRALSQLDGVVHDGGTVVVISGPRFSTRAESRWYAKSGFQIINMTQYPEAALAREAKMCYANISLITDFDAGLAGEPGIIPVTAALAVAELRRNIDRVKHSLQLIVAALPPAQICQCTTTISS